MASTSTSTSKGTQTRQQPPSAELQTRLLNISNQIEQKLASKFDGEISKFLKMQPGIKYTLLFDPEKIEKTTVEYKNEDGTKSSPTERLKCMVKITDEYGNLHGDEFDQDVEWTVSLTTGQQILKWVLKGFYVLDIIRSGVGKFDTKYDVTPVINNN